MPFFYAIIFTEFLLAKLELVIFVQTDLKKTSKL